MRVRLRAALAVGAVVTLSAVWSGEAEAEPVVSSWYGPGFEGSPTANGDVYKPGARTAAHPSLPFGTELLVTYGGQETVVEVTDRGPYVGDRGLDLSQAAAEEIGLIAAGADAVDVKVLTGTEDRREAHRVEYASPKRYVVEKKYTAPRDADDGEAWRINARPYLKVLGAAFTPYSSNCRYAPIKAPAPAADTRSLSIDFRRVQESANVERCSPGTRALVVA